MVKLNLGCPRHHEGWVCVDGNPKEEGVVKEDAYLYLMRLKPNSVDEIYTKNLLEHLPNVGLFLALCQTALRHGGALTVITDNAEYVPYYLPFYVNHTGIGAHAKAEYAESVEHGHTKHFAVYTKLHLENFLKGYCAFATVKITRVWGGARLKAVALK